LTRYQESVMKAVRIAGVMMACAAIAASAASAEPAQRGRGPAVPSCTTLACDVQGDWERTRNLVLGLVNAMPDDKWSFKPTPPQGTFAERALHIADIDLKLLSTLGGKTPPPAAINPKAVTKAEVVAALQSSFDYGAALLKEFTDAQLTERIASMPFLGPSASRLKVVYFSMQHTNDLYGQLVVYLRLNGITPPASNRGA
jgi:uncharacterized damage-inducible protein DinB